MIFDCFATTATSPLAYMAIVHMSTSDTKMMELKKYTEYYYNAAECWCQSCWFHHVPDDRREIGRQLVLEKICFNCKTLVAQGEKFVWVSRK